MSKADLIRWSGMSLLAAGILVAIGALMHPDESVEGAMALPSWGTAHMILVLSLILVVFGLTGLYGRLAGSGMLSLVGYVLAVASSLMFLGITFVEAWIAPAVVASGPEGAALMAMDGPIMSGQLGMVLMAAALAYAVGWLLLGVAVWQDGGLPKWAGLLLIAGGLLMPFSPPLPQIAFQLGAVLLGAAAVWLGWTMWSTGGASA
ncbi:MAG: hypothetical protein H6648_07410 [Caldilineae bacterium]|nr:hypothetical protein [Chloroflexota bacterium]MCB9176971.1 hypothetical protein [Caldilineae bacterium]